MVIGPQESQLAVHLRKARPCQLALESKSNLLETKKKKNTKKYTLSDPDQVVSEQFFSRSFDPPGSDVAMQFLMLIAVTLYEIFFF